jgi:hypothetical protein
MVLYGSETWSHIIGRGTQTEGIREGVVRRIFISKKDELTGDWRKLRNEELHNGSHRQVKLGRTNEVVCDWQGM